MAEKCNNIIKLRECFISPFKLLCLLQMSSWGGGVGRQWAGGEAEVLTRFTKSQYVQRHSENCIKQSK